MKRSTKPLKASGLSTRSTLKSKKKLNKRSKKTEKLYVERRKVVERILGERPWCEACPIFAADDGKITYARRKSQDVHELLRRSQGGSIIEESNLMAVCRPCHDRIGRNPQKAFELGLSIESWKRNKS